LSGTVRAVADIVVRAMGSASNVYAVLEDTDVLGRCDPDVHVSIRGKKRN